jgi:hypothetical protein
MSERLGHYHQQEQKKPLPLSQEVIAQFLFSSGVIRHYAEFREAREVVPYARNILENDIYVRQVMDCLGLTVENIVYMDEALWRLIVNELAYGE